MIYVLCALIGYLMGGLSGGIFIARLFGLKDIRREGSGNAGTTNVMRTLGYLPAILTLIFDALKVFGAAKIALAIAGTPGMLIAGFAAVVGHVFPIWFRFRGGKGIAAGFGFMLAVSPLIALILLAVQIVILAITRTMSLASLVNIVLFAVLTAIVFRGEEYYALYVLTASATSLLSLWAHRTNIDRLIRNKENKLDFNRIKFWRKRK